MSFKSTSEYSQKISDPESFVWIKKINKERVVQFYELAHVILILNILLSLIYFFFMIWYDLSYWVPGITFTLSILLLMLSCYVLSQICCPDCGYTPAKNREGKMINQRQFEDRLLKLKKCPKCEKR